MYEYKGKKYPDYLQHGNASQFIDAIAKQFCKGPGLDVGGGRWPLYGSIKHDVEEGGAYALPDEKYLYIFSSHCLEHLEDPIRALEEWRGHLLERGVLFLYLPHPDMEYWLPQNCKKHLHSWQPQEMSQIVSDLGFENVIHSERDLNWSFAVTGVWTG